MEIASFSNTKNDVLDLILKIILFILAPALTLSKNKIYLNLLKNSTAPSLSKFFKNINYFVKPLFLQIVTTFFVILWSLLFIIPGIVKSFSYSMAFYILAENPEITVLEAIRESKKLMYGYKMDYFILSLSFFGWILLSFITCGLAFIYAGPYIDATFTNFYLQIKSENEEAKAS